MYNGGDSSSRRTFYKLLSWKSASRHLSFELEVNPPRALLVTYVMLRITHQSSHASHPIRRVKIVTPLSSTTATLGFPQEALISASAITQLYRASQHRRKAA